MSQDLRPSAHSCVECGGTITPGTGYEVVYGMWALPAGAPVKVPGDDMEVFTIPGLLRCERCATLLSRGQLKTNVSIYDAVTYLVRVYIPGAQAFLQKRGGMLGDVTRKRVEAELEAATDAAAAIIANLLIFGQPRDAGVVNLDDRHRPVDPEGVLDSIRMEEDGSSTFECPDCGDRHDVSRLFDDDLKGLFEDVVSDSKD